MKIVDIKKENDYLIQMINVGYLFHENINWYLQKGEFHAIIGSSGAGKSSFLKVLLGLQEYTGKILDIHGEVWNCYNQNIAVQFQSSALLSHLTIGENVYLPLCMKYGIEIDLAMSIAVNFMERVDLSIDDFYKMPSECSGGMQKRASLARAMIVKPQILFLDEPTSGLDNKMAKMYDSLLTRFVDTSIIMVSHDLERVKVLANRVTIILKDGVYTDTFANLQNHENVKVREFLKYHD